MKCIVAGGSGFIGSALVGRLTELGEVVVLTRKGRAESGRPVEWHPPAAGPWAEEVASADVVVNLAGENIGAGRWTAERKRRLISSRLEATGALVEAMRLDPTRPRTFVSASAIGYYGSRGDEALDESAPAGEGFLASLAQQWEEAARAAEDVARVVIVRLGVVLDEEGGALERMLLPFRLGVGGPIGSGRQWMSWVDRADVIRFIEWAALRREARGVYNVTAPEPVRNRDFAKALGRALHRPAVIPAPAFALRMLFGEMADEVLLGGQRVVPSRATAEGFSFTYPKLEQSLQRIFGWLRQTPLNSAT
ncbi:MAG TPA: TIGR01777 family oxidoreductase [Thermoanaerobaculia bacterium]|nr:TIGR01777 family oxidoreductase [Thermoanaerobaculia bacterium]